MLIVQAPMAGGPSTPELAAAVNAGGGYGYLAAGYLTPDALHEQLRRTRALTGAPFGVNVFVPGPDDADPGALAAYSTTLEPDAKRLGVSLGDPRWSDDGYAEKLTLLAAQAIDTVSFTFGRPSAEEVEALHRAGTQVAVTVTSVAEAVLALQVGPDALIVQGSEAGGHQAVFDPRWPNETPLREALIAIRQITELPLTAAGAIMTADDVRAAESAGAQAVQIGTALLRTPEAGTSPLYRNSLDRFEDTVLTRAFSGRWARGLANRLALRDDAPNGYPNLHYLTGPLRRAATAAGDRDLPNFWAGTGFRATRAEPAAAVVARLSRPSSLLQ